MFFSSFLIIEFIFIPAGITQIFIAAAELVIPTVIPTKEAKVERHPVTVEAKISKCSVEFKILQAILGFLHTL